MPEGAFSNPLILQSEHKRILASAQERYDLAAKLRERAAYWRGIGTTVWVSGALAVAGLYVGFYFGVSVVQ